MDIMNPWFQVKFELTSEGTKWVARPAAINSLPFNLAPVSAKYSPAQNFHIIIWMWNRMKENSPSSFSHICFTALQKKISYIKCLCNLPNTLLLSSIYFYNAYLNAQGDGKGCMRNCNQYEIQYLLLELQKPNKSIIKNNKICSKYTR